MQIATTPVDDHNIVQDEQTAPVSHDANLPIAGAAAEAEAEGHEGGGHEIVIAPETLFNIGFLPVTNTLLVSWMVIGIIIIAAIIARLNLKRIPTGFYNFVESIIEWGWNTVEDLAHSRSKFFFPWVMTFFIFILVANLIGLFPGFATITYNHLPLLRSINSDLNMTLSLALLSVVVTHYYAIKILGIKNYLKKWFSVEMFGVFLFVGLLELVGEFTKIASLSFRLFGNIFAGEVVLGTVSSIFAFFVPLPFYFLELIVAFVQAAVFMMLTLVFMVILTEKHESH